MMVISRKKEQVKKIAQGILDLPTLPTVVAKIVELVDNPRTNASTLARLISTDPALTARMLKLANSAYYGFPRRIGTINLAIVVLGFDTVRDMAVSASLVERFSLEYDGHDLLAEFWEHSIGTAIAARMITRLGNHRTVGEAFVAGLLHDIGRLVIARYLPDEFQEIQEKLSHQKLPLWTIEMDVLGMSHAEIGGSLTKKWNIPEPITDAINYHHLPFEREDVDLLTCVIHLAEFISLQDEALEGLEGRILPLNEKIVSTLELRRNEDGEADIDWYREKFALEFNRAETFRDLVLGQTGQENNNAGS
jgi:HD-like signal output (HDOD) protein